MLSWKRTMGLALAAALGLQGVPAGAENLDLDEMAAAIAFPIITGGYEGNELKDVDGTSIISGYGEAVTLITVTNGKSENVLLKIDMISGDVNGENGGDNWQSTSFECELTGRETTTFVIKTEEPGQSVGPEGQSKVFVECSNGDDPEGNPRALFTNVGNGIMFVAVADPEDGSVVSEDVIFGDAIVVDIEDSAAFSFYGIGFQAGETSNDGNKVYEFNGGEYRPFPAVLATNFMAPHGPGDDDPRDGVDVELVLFTLDGTTGNIPVPRVKIGGFAYNDDEMAFDFTWEFDCFDIVALEDINPNFIWNLDNNALGLGSISGHLEMTAQIIGSTGPDVHDAAFGDGNNVRRRGFHGWIVMEFRNQGGNEILPGDQPIAGTPSVALTGGDQAYVGRPLAQSTTTLIPFLGDDNSTLDADTRN